MASGGRIGGYAHLLWRQRYQTRERLALLSDSLKQLNSAASVSADEAEWALMSTRRSTPAYPFATPLKHRSPSHYS